MGSKKDRNKPGIVPGVTYRCGFDLSVPQLPIYLGLSVQGRELPTRWTAADGEAMGYALLKAVELCRRRLAEEKKGFAAHLAKLEAKPEPGDAAHSPTEE